MGSCASCLKTCCCPDNPNPKPSDDEPIRFFTIGCGGAGKTTIIRQLKCLCKVKPRYFKVCDENWEAVNPDNIFTKAEMKQFVQVIRLNIITALSNIEQQADEWDIQVEDAKSRDILRAYMDSYEAGQSTIDRQIPPQVPIALKKLILDVGIKATLARIDDIHSTKNRLEDGTLLFIDEQNINRVFDSNFEPTPQDIVHVRLPTDNKRQYRFRVKDKKIEIVDMGGQREQMAKLVEYLAQFRAEGNFQSPTNFILYIASLSDFNSVDKSQRNRSKTLMDLSLGIFEKMMTLHDVQDCKVFIFLNKEDRFKSIVEHMCRSSNGREKLLSKFDEMKEADKKKIRDESKTPQEVVEMLKKATLKKYDNIHTKSRRGELFYQYTSAINQKAMENVYNVIVYTMVQKFISQGGFIM